MNRVVQGAAFATGAIVTALAWYALGTLAARCWRAWYQPIYRDGG